MHPTDHAGAPGAAGVDPAIQDLEDPKIQYQSRSDQHDERISKLSHLSGSRVGAGVDPFAQGGSGERSNHLQSMTVQALQQTQQ
jgi:hypothetical protein